MRYGLSPVLYCLFLAMANPPALAGPPALPAASGYDALPGFGYEGDAQARAAWMPMHESAPVSWVAAGPRGALRMPCNLAGTSMPRASWDWRAPVDLADARGVQFRFFCADPGPVAHFNIYFQSGDGWYCGSFAPTQLAGWNHIRMGKADFSMEGKPAGWGKITLTRISAWRGQGTDTECFVADLGALPGSSDVVVLRQESVLASKSGDARTVENAVSMTSSLLDELGLPYGLLSDLDCTPAHLKRVKLVVLPYCPGDGGPLVSSLVSYVQGGGNVVAFYSVPGALLSALGIKPGRHVAQARPGHFASIRAAAGNALPGLPESAAQASWNIMTCEPGANARTAAFWHDDTGASTGLPAIVVSDRGAVMTHILLGDDRSNKRQLLLAMIGRFVPAYWKLAATESLRQVGAFGPYEGFDAAVAGISAQAAGQAAAQRDLERARELYGAAKARAEKAAYAGAMAASGQAREALTAAYCAVQKPQPGEQRGWWCHSPMGVAGMTWDDAIRTLAENGFNAIFPNMLWGGSAWYQSKVLPVMPEVATQGDQIAACLAACRKYGVQCHVWKVNWNMSNKPSHEFVAKMRKEGRLQVKFGGTAPEPWLCPSHPENRKLEIESMVEVARKYDVDGIHFDYIRYPDSDGCFCAGCRARFEKRVGRKVEGWPGAVRTDPGLSAKWLQFRRDQITAVVAGVSERVRQERPGVRVSAAVFRNWPSDRDSIGQDWKLWCEKGYLDFVCPMDYTPHNVEFENVVRQQTAWCAGIPCYPGIGLSVWPDPCDIVKLIDQVGITRRLGTGGFTIFNYGAPQADAVVPLCGKGLTRR